MDNSVIHEMIKDIESCDQDDTDLTSPRPLWTQRQSLVKKNNKHYLVNLEVSEYVGPDIGIMSRH